MLSKALHEALNLSQHSLKRGVAQNEGDRNCLQSAQARKF